MNIIKNIHKAIKKSQLDHIKWSGYMIGWSAEYLITTFIAQELSKFQNKGIDGIYVEYSIKDLVKESKKKVPKSIRTGRCDLCIEFENDLQSIVEVKNTISQRGKKLNSVFKDIERIKYFLNNDTSFEKSYICFIAGNTTNEEKLILKVEGWFSEIEEKYSNLEFNLSIIPEKHITDESKTIYWATVVAEISNKTLERNS